MQFKMTLHIDVLILDKNNTVLLSILKVSVLGTQEVTQAESPEWSLILSRYCPSRAKVGTHLLPNCPIPQN